jgi:hypothetical protein
MITAKKMDKATTIKKEKGTIKIPSGNSIIKFRDDKRNDSYLEYTVLGQNKKRKWVLIMAQDYNQNYYYLVNQTYNKIDTLFDEPQIYGERFLCGHGGSADGYPAFLEIWDTQNEKLKLILKFKWESYGLDIRNLYLREDTLFIKNFDDKYLKMKI